MVTDINQGAVPALLPFLISAYGLTYAAAAAVVFATNMSSSLVQPLFGHLADRISKPWLMPMGLVLAGAGLALAGGGPQLPAGALRRGSQRHRDCGLSPCEGARLVNALAGARKATALSLFGVGGQFGFAIGPVLTTFVVASFGLDGTLLLAVPAVSMALVLAALHRALFKGHSAASGLAAPSRGADGEDAWGPFGRLTAAAFFRAFAFYGFNTFLPLYFIDVLHQSKMTGGTAMTVFLGSGACGTLLGGRLGDRYGYRRVALIAFCFATVLLPLFIGVHDVPISFLLLVPMGLVHFLSFSPIVVMGQKFLPNRIGFASGVTLGLSISVGGIAAPIIGWLADIYGMQSAFMVMAVFPVIAGCLVLSLPGRHPATRPSFFG
jgi:FSR family fosmidomycin resistance protein-like MFS transporter